MIDAIFALPQNLQQVYLLAILLLVSLVIDCIINIHRRAWSIAALVVYITVFIWYFLELIYTPENFTKFDSSIIENCYLQIILFLVAFRIFIPSICRRFSRNYHQVWKFSIINPEKILVYLAVIWLLLLLYGTLRLGGDVIQALLPINSRTAPNMWSRGALGGSDGFIVSSATYIYLLVCSFFGVLLPLQTKPYAKFLNIALILITLPYFIFMGSRNVLLAVTFPGYLSYFLLSRDKIIKKTITTIIIYLIISNILLLVINYRNIGFQSFFNSVESQAYIEETKTNEKHLGLNMLEELANINNFYKNKQLEPSYGMGYLSELLNFIPRAIWPNKPSPSIDYSRLRGFSSKTRDVGVFATISTGMIGQSVTNFGRFLGPIAGGFLVACWAAFMSRLWLQKFSTLRLSLFMICLGLTFNLGRDITFLVLWPAVFGYVIVRLFENNLKRKNQNLLQINPSISIR